MLYKLTVEWINRKHTIFMEEPSKCKLQMSRQAKQKEKKKEMLEQVSVFFSQQPLHWCSVQNSNDSVHHFNSETAGIQQLMQNLHQLSLYRLILSVYFMIWYVKKNLNTAVEGHCLKTDLAFTGRQIHLLDSHQQQSSALVEIF